MFTVKATYHGHTRKYTFSDTNTFPTYDQICHQLHRVFPITQNYYLSKLLFSPDASQSSRILLSKEVHNAFDYHKCIRQFTNRAWPHALLRLTVFDEGPLTFPLNNAETSRLTSSSVADSGRSMSVSQRPAVPPYMKPSVSFQMPMDVDTMMTESSSRSNTYARPQLPAVPVPQHRLPAQAPYLCCSVSQGKAEIKAMLHNFQEDLNRVMTNNFDESLPSTSLKPISADAVPTSSPPPFLCSLCIQHRQGTWYSCNNCHVVVCEACHNAARPGFCLSVMGPHQMKLTPSPNSDSYVPIPRLPVPWTPRPETSEMTGILNTSSEPTTSTQTGNTPSASSAVPLPVIHRGVSCDVCNKTIEGVRHKCLDCPDYDLCTPCITAGVSEVHNPFHEFFEINEPGRVIVHTVFSGNGERESQGTPTARAPVSGATAEDSVIHFANCNLCDSRIRGDRYKCLDCPDFDTCVSCFSITNEQHPNHGFVKIQKKEDFIRRRNIVHSMHNATCNCCQKRLFGFRFKCMHPECPDYDLCESCEAFPIAVHPSNHPMLKMKTPDTAIPTVYRVGQTSLIEPTTVVNEHQTSIRSPESTPSSTAHRVLPAAAPTVPVHANIPAPPAHARSSSPVEDDMMRSCTPVARSFFDYVVFEKAEARLNQAEVPSPAPPKLPPKPDMISQPSWASIPDFFSAAPLPRYAPQHVQSSAFIPQNTVGNSQMTFCTIQHPQDIEPPVPAMPTPPPLHVLESVPAPQVAPEDNVRPLPSVSSHTSNPWPTTNPTEREELLKLIAEFSGPFVPVPGLSPVLVNPPSFNKPLEQPAATPLRNSPEFLTPPPTAVELPRGIPSPVEQRSTLESQECRPSANDPLPSWASLTPDVSHLMRENLERSTDPKPASVVSEPTSVGSPLSGQALLNSPIPSGSPAYLRSLSELVHQLPSLVPSKIEKLSETHEALSAKFVEDVTVSDGQTFPPGAEFVKCWRLLNTGEQDWPENTELVFLAGDPLSDSALPPVLVGRVAAGAEFDVWTGELKAPDTPGRYVGYWKMKADGELFGNSLWIEINVVESDSHHSSDDSMAASSIIMPISSPSAQQSEHVSSTTVHSLSGVSTIVTDDGISEIGSDNSSVSLISMPSSPSDDEDEALFHDSRSQITVDRAAATSGMDYVMLYDDNSSSEE